MRGNLYCVHRNIQFDADIMFSKICDVPTEFCRLREYMAAAFGPPDVSMLKSE